jgi:hypothetical protein
MAKQGSATPGEYAKLKSLFVLVGLVETTDIFPGLPLLWYFKASSFNSLMLCKIFEVANLS